jgi:hypothetical protein
MWERTPSAEDTVSTHPPLDTEDMASASANTTPTPQALGLKQNTYLFKDRLFRFGAVLGLNSGPQAC